ncbi:hypothetical protein [Lacticaseibacillus absianus]|uniref:hypothetical protein n=1 Tax=Lacticaseibacillus absianus TaxID=2729623 RepID=UPI0015CEE58A|nr:hypothetical protein [Lacticaseibacillus absianus]
MMEIKAVRIGECFFEAGQFNRWRGDEHSLFMTDNFMSAQLWQGDEDVSPEEIADFCGGKVVTLREVRDEN